MIPAPTRCKACGKPILFLKDALGKTMPVDPTISPEGNVVIEGENCRVLAGAAREEWKGPLHTSHFQTCPQAERFRK